MLRVAAIDTSPFHGRFARNLCTYIIRIVTRVSRSDATRFKVSRGRWCSSGSYTKYLCRFLGNALAHSFGNDASKRVQLHTQLINCVNFNRVLLTFLTFISSLRITTMRGIRLRFRIAIYLKHPKDRFINNSNYLR